MTPANSAAAPALAPDSVLPKPPLPLWASIVATCALVAGIIFWLQSPLPPPKLVNRTQVTRDGLPKTNVLSDGSDLYLSETLERRHIISKVSIGGSSVSTLALPFTGAVGYAIAPDRSSILLSVREGSQDALWTYPLAHGTSRRFQSTGRNATWAPDGQHIAYARNSTLWVANSDGRDARELATVEGTVFYPRFSPDGRRIRFSVGNTLQNSSTSSLWEIGADGAALHSLFKGWHEPPGECCGSWTSDGRYFIFQVSQSRPANVTNLWALAEPTKHSYRKPGASPIQLTNGPMSFGMATPDPNRNNKLWALGVQPAGEFVKYEQGSKQFVSLLPGISGTDLDFSRDGKWVAYVAIPQGTLWRCRTDGSDRLELTTPSQHAALPRWSPDGKQIIFMSVEPGKAWKTLVVPATGDAARQLIAGESNQVDANWSPDGTRVVFGDEWSAHNPAIQILDLKTGTISIVPGSEGLFSPRWSPDGRFIAALSIDFTKLMLFDFRLQKWSPWLVEPAGAVSYPSWSADSRYLYFEDLVTGEDSIRRIKIGEAKPESVVVLEGLERYPGPLGLWNGRTAEGSQVFVRDRSTQEVYGLDLDLP
jgi:Tol biopolymer transport system component